MDKYRLISTAVSGLSCAKTRQLSMLVPLLLLCSCGNYRSIREMPRPAATVPMTAPANKQQDPFIKENISVMKKLDPESAPPRTPDFQPVSDDISPAKSRLVNIQARNSALGDILHVIADAAALNLIIGNGVDLEKSVTITLKRVSADDALSTILESMDYFYTIKGNILSVEATGTKTFELGHPALVQNYNVEIGGDILGSVTSSSSSGGGGGSSNIKGTINKTVKSDTKAFDFWESLEKNLLSMLGKADSSAGRAAQTNRTAPSATSAAGGVQNQPSPPVQMQPEPPPSSAGDSSQSAHQNIIINRLTGTIVVTATRKNLARIESYLETLRKALNRQVLVEARIVEVQLNDSLEFGINWEFLENVKWLNTTGALTGSFGKDMTKVAADALTSGSFKVGYTGTNAKVLLTALSTQGEVKTLSNPRVNVLNGQTAMLSVGRNFNYIAKVTSTTTTTAGSAPTVTYTVDTGNVLSGIIIGIAPHINKNGEIRLTVTPIISHLVSLEDKSIGSAGNEIKLTVPTVDLRELSTTVKVRHGELIIIGGLIDNKQNFKDEKIPLLGDIPWLGTLFTRKNNEDSRKELVVILQPYLISND